MAPKKYLFIKGVLLLAYCVGTLVSVAASKRVVPPLFYPYGVLSENSSYYVVDPTNLAPYVNGIDYLCDNDWSISCTVYSNIVPDSNNRVWKGSLTQVVVDHGRFFWGID